MTVSSSQKRVVDAAHTLGLTLDIQDFPQGTKTAADAAAAIGCEVAAIIKSLVFVIDDEVVVCLVPGDRRLDVQKLAVLASGVEVRRADLDEARAATGFAPGGTPPFGHLGALEVFADQGLRRCEVLWAAAGTPRTVFPLRLADLERIVPARWGDIAESVH